MFIKKIRLQGFRSFVDNTEIIFPSNGLILINGISDDKLTTSGIGKSSILYAIAYALYCNDIPSTVLKNYNTNNLEVELILSDNNHEYKIIRTLKKFKVFYDNEEIIGHTSVAQEYINEIFKIKKLDLLKFLLFRFQRSHGLFINNTDSQNKLFLLQLLSLEEFEDKIDFFKNEYNKLISQYDILSNILNQTQENLKTMPSIDENIITDLHNNINILKEEINNIQKEIEQKTLNINADKINNQIKDIDEKINQYYQLQTKINTLTKQQSFLQEKFNVLKEEIKSLKQSICPVCKREWHQAYQLYIEKGKILKNIYDQINTNTKQLQEYTNRLNQYKLSDLNHIKNNLMQEKTNLYTPINHLRELLISKNNQLNSLNSQLQILKNNKESIKVLSEKITTTKDEMNKLDQQIQIYRHITQIFSREGFLNIIFDNILNNLNNMVNNLLSYIPNTSDITIFFQNNNITKSNKIQNKLTYKILKNGNEINFKALSGGQQSAVELCVDLSLIEIIKKQLGININFICLDESMDGMDVNTKISFLTLLKKNLPGQIIIIDHMHEIKIIAEETINIGFDGQKSYIA